MRFRDRPLKDGEKSHYYCEKCGVDLHPDTAHNHKCSSVFSNKGNRFDVNKSNRETRTLHR